ARRQLPLERFRRDDGKLHVLGKRKFHPLETALAGQRQRGRVIEIEHEPAAFSMAEAQRCFYTAAVVMQQLAESRHTAELELSFELGPPAAEHLEIAHAIPS